MPSLAGIAVSGGVWMAAGLALWGGFVASGLRFDAEPPSPTPFGGRLEVGPTPTRRHGPRGVVVLDLDVVGALRRSLAERRN